jgi:hypothetical protein
MSITRAAIRRMRHLHGWRTQEKLIILNVDDYGTIRLASRRARDTLQKRIPGFAGQMDTFDALETRADLEALFDVLRSVQGADGIPPAFTAYALSANPDFNALRDEGRYAPEGLPDTFACLAAEQPDAYEGAWSLWQQGMAEGLIHPQFHGREHVSVPLIEAKLTRGDDDLLANIEVESMAGLKPIPEMPGVGFTHSFGLHDKSLLPQHREIFADGLARFAAVYGFASRTFTPPAQQLHPSLDAYVHELGVEAIDKSFFYRRPLGNGRRRPSINFLRPSTQNRVGTIVRTLSFEPTSGTKSDPVGHALAQIDTAFRWRKPAIISSHRVNYAGHINPKNREQGLAALAELLQGIVKRWPDVRFITADALVDEMREGKGSA